ncbi:hypothetical protein HUE58_01950 [Candidatus Ruthia endofausta]|uniref:Cytochrome C oxidase subunit II n=1 Tax=Candidatus Ruthia endofausta TaxID=2738852 RepID=A0A6N0HNQ4_9GAMM|nr:hypothetical protein [Candidatus Ruthia endofausta]QKQ23954.1 hypothetical protein HUE58_01950 [Candidatus Ruthia endofausta]
MDLSLGGMTIGIVALLTFSAVSFNIYPPSNVEKIDSKPLHLGGEFSEDNLGLNKMQMVAARYGFYPQRIEVPVNITFTKAGEYPLFCNEFCGLDHDYMWSKLIISEAEKQ